ncbi:MAG: hypothetical protein OJF58_001716 [Enhydrobacter sp.]|nr:MAG: hypothetical protein OJF58_001716 [Enhydrobacter sp.]
MGPFGSIKQGELAPSSSHQRKARAALEERLTVGIAAIGAQSGARSSCAARLLLT